MPTTTCTLFLLIHEHLRLPRASAPSTSYAFQWTSTGTATLLADRRSPARGRRRFSVAFLQLYNAHGFLHHSVHLHYSVPAGLVMGYRRTRRRAFRRAHMAPFSTPNILVLFPLGRPATTPTSSPVEQMDIVAGDVTALAVVVSL